MAEKKKTIKKKVAAKKDVSKKEAPVTASVDATDDWETYVRSEVNALLDKFLPLSTGGDVSIGYGQVIIEETEGGPVYDDDKVAGVEISLKFEFVGDVSKKHITE